MTSHQYWMFDWLDEYGDVGHEKIREFLEKDKTATQKLQEQAVGADTHEATPQLPSTGENLVAGTGIDLTTNAACSNAGCRLAKVDELFRRAWHYFDRIIVADSITHQVAGHWDSGTQDRLVQEVAVQLEVLNYVRNIGAQDLLHFAEKPHAEIAHWDSVTNNAVSETALELTKDFRESLVQDSKIFTFEPEPGIKAWMVSHPDLEIVEPVKASADEDSGPDRGRLADTIIARHAGLLMSDLVMSKQANSPLGTTNEIHKILLESSEGPEAGTVAFNLELPYLEGVSIVDLLKLRKDEKDMFDDFRHSLKAAIQDRIDNSESSDPEAIAIEIENDVIGPRLRKISRQMNAAARNLKSKTMVTMGVGALATTVGLATGLGSMAFLGIVAGAVLDTSPFMSYFDKKEQIELDQMYFLWKAVHK